LKNFYHKGEEGAKGKGKEGFSLKNLIRLRTKGSIRLRGVSFLQELYDFEKILAVKKVNVDTLNRMSGTGQADEKTPGVFLRRAGVLAYSVRNGVSGKSRFGNCSLA
jgi:hypothetical protein